MDTLTGLRLSLVFSPANDKLYIKLTESLSQLLLILQNVIVKNISMFIF